MTMKVRALLGLVVASAAMVLASCGHYTCGATFGASTCSPSGGGIGSGGNGSGIVFAYLLDEGALNGGVGMAADKLDLSVPVFVDIGSAFTPPPLPTSVFKDGGTVVVSLPTQKYLYIPFSNGTVYGYAIDGTSGALTEVLNSPFSAPGGTSIAADPAGRFLFVSDFATGDISAFTISATNGSLTAVGTTVSPVPPAQMTTDGQGKFLYVSEGSGGLKVAAFAINQTTGALATTVPGSPFSFPLGQVLGEKSGKFLLGITGANNQIHVLAIDATSGAIAEVAGSPFPTVAAAKAIVVHPTGSFVYDINGTGTAMEGYQINSASGALAAVAGSPFTGIDIDAAQFEQSGKFLFGAGIGHVGSPNFGPYPTDPATGIVTLPTKFSFQGFLGFGFAVSDLNTAP
jgi:6-phosphogluconolactonase (cycloisomerase 2 family)